MLKKTLIVLLFLFGFQQQSIFAGGCPIFSTYKINGGHWTQGFFDETHIYSVYINPSDTVYMYLQDCNGGPLLNCQWLYNGQPIPGATNISLATDSAGTYRVNGVGYTYVEFVIMEATSCPVLNAGSDLVLCNTISSIALQGSRSYYSNIRWTGGSGNFSPDAYTMDATYLPSLSDIAAGVVKLCLKAEGSCASSVDSIQIIFTTCITAGTKKILSDENIKIYPNPNDGKISVDFSDVKGIIGIEMLNLLGEKIKTAQVEASTNQIDFDMGDLNAGVYFVALINDQGQRWMKRIVKR